MTGRNRILLTATLMLFGAVGTAVADVYSWKDPATGRNRISNLPPTWYSRLDEVSGPPVTVSRGAAIIDDTSLPIAKRRQMLGIPESPIPGRPAPAPAASAAAPAEKK